jgi:hypothetical protein
MPLLDEAVGRLARCLPLLSGTAKEVAFVLIHTPPRAIAEPVDAGGLGAGAFYHARRISVTGKVT